MKQINKILCLMAILVSVFVCSGCARMQTTSNESREPSVARKFREAWAGTSQFGLDPRSREIERNLGVE